MNRDVGLILCDWVIWKLRKTVWPELHVHPPTPFLSLLLFLSFPPLILSPGSLSSEIKFFYLIFYILFYTLPITIHQYFFFLFLIKKLRFKIKKI